MAPRKSKSSSTSPDVDQPYVLTSILHAFVEMGLLADCTGATAKVWVALLHHSGYRTGEAWPSVSTLAKEAGVARSTVSLALKQLKESKALVVVESGGPRKSTRRRLYVPSKTEYPERSGIPSSRVSRANRSGYPEPSGAGIPSDRDRTSPSNKDKNNTSCSSNSFDDDDVEVKVKTRRNRLTKRQDRPRRNDILDDVDAGDFCVSDSQLEEMAREVSSFGIDNRSWAETKIRDICEMHGRGTAKRIIKYLKYRKRLGNYTGSLGGIASKALTNPRWAIEQANRCLKEKPRIKKYSWTKERTRVEVA